MTRPAVSAAAERIYGQLGAYSDGDPETGWLLLRFCDALATIAARANEVLRDDARGSGWRRMYDPDRAPEWALGWLSQHTGLVDLPAIAPAAQRALIRDAPGLRRGSLQAIAAAARSELTGTRQVVVRERDGGSRWRLRIVTYMAETPDPGRVLAAITAQKPVFFRIFHEVVVGWFIDAMEAFHAVQTVGQVEATYPTLTRFEDRIPA